jgi:hypothetical protein
MLRVVVAAGFQLHFSWGRLTGESIRHLRGRASYVHGERKRRGVLPPEMWILIDYMPFRWDWT